MGLPKGLATGFSTLDGMKKVQATVNASAGMKKLEQQGALYPGMRIILPLPPKELHPNTRVNFMVKARHTKSFRSITAMCALQYVRGHNWTMVARARIRAVFFFTTKRSRDGSNLNAWLKACEDGLQDAGVIINDSGFIWLPPDAYCSIDHPRVELYIEEDR